MEETSKKVTNNFYSISTFLFEVPTWEWEIAWISLTLKSCDHTKLPSRFRWNRIDRKHQHASVNQNGNFTLELKRKNTRSEIKISITTTSKKKKRERTRKKKSLFSANVTWSQIPKCLFPHSDQINNQSILRLYQHK